MNEEIVISVDVHGTATENPLGLEIWLDNNIVHDVNPGVEVETFRITLNDSNESEHELKFVLKNKTVAHTQVDESGNILDDATITINNLKFDDFAIGYAFNKLATYTHNFNGTGPESTHDFFNTIGCNGTVSLKFTTPMYLWLLEHI